MSDLRKPDVKRASATDDEAKARLMARIAVAERERAAGLAFDAFETLDELENRYGIQEKQ